MEAILESAARLLEQRGYEAMTTNHVAARAGASVGTLYQYFPNKDALVRALLERHLEEAAAMRPIGLADGRPLQLRERVALAVDWWLAVHRTRPALHQALTDLAPRILGAEATGQFRALWRTAAADALEPHREELCGGDLDLAVLLYGQCLEAMSHGIVAEAPERLGDPDLIERMTEVLLTALGAQRRRDRNTA